MKRGLVVSAVIAAMIAAMLAAAPRAHAQETDDSQSVRVRTGDTLELLAAEYYGDRNLAAFIVAENHIQKPKPLRPGERLRIPVTRVVTTQKGDDFVSLAANYLGDPKRAPILAEFNKMSPMAVLPAGLTVMIPADVAYTAAGTESLAQIAATFLRDSKQAELLREYNGLAKLTLEKGETIAIPMLARTREGKMPGLDEEAKARREERDAAMAAVETALPKARTAWLQGDFAAVKGALEKIEPEVDFLDPDIAVEVEVLLAKAHLADDDVQYAVAKFSQVRNRNPRYKLSAYRESPKVIAAWQQAGGEVSDQ